MAGAGGKTRLYISIGIAVALVLVAVAQIMRLRGGAPEVGRDKIWLMDVETGESFCLTAKEYREMATSGTESGTITMTTDPGQMRFVNPKTGKKTLAYAEKCKKCGQVFLPDYMNSSDYFDRCPNCGYSHYEQTRKKRPTGK